MSISSAVPGGGPMPASEAPADLPSGARFLGERLGYLQDLDGAALREEWRRLYRSEPPRISRDLLVRAISYRLQELEFGGLPKWARQSLAGRAIGSNPGVKPPAPAEMFLRPGARLIREWHGRTHTVTVLNDGFKFEGRRYRSLTQIAREITGAHWSGPRFFGLTGRKGASGPDEAGAEAVATGTEETRKIAREEKAGGQAGCHD